MTINPPEGWNGTAPGKKVDDNTYSLPPRQNTVYFTPQDIYAVGNFAVHTTKRGGTEYRVAHAPSADAPASPSEHLELLANTGEILGKQIGVDSSFGRLGLVVPDDGGRTESAQGRDHSYLVTETGRYDPIKLMDSGGSIYVHELAHTYQYIDKPDWIKEGGATFLEPYALYKSGYISKEEYKNTLSNYATIPGPRDRERVARFTPYEGGATVLAALDLDIRARTDGEKNVTHFFAKIFDQRHDTGFSQIVSAPEIHSALRDLTGEDYSNSLLTYVDSTERPTAVVKGNYSLSDGVKDPYVSSSSSSADLQQRVSLVEDQLDQKNQTITALRAQLQEKNQTITSLQEQLEERNQTIANLQEQQNEQNQTGSETQQPHESAPSTGLTSILYIVVDILGSIGSYI